MPTSWWEWVLFVVVIGAEVSGFGYAVHRWGLRGIHQFLVAAVALALRWLVDGAPRGRKHDEALASIDRMERELEIGPYGEPGKFWTYEPSNDRPDWVEIDRARRDRNLPDPTYKNERW